MSPAAAGWLQVGLVLLALALAHRPLGDWMARVFTAEQHWRVERVLYRAVGVDADGEQRWPVYLRSVFIHEMTHVWQTQTRGRFYLPLMRHPFCRYAYQLERERPFDWYGLEQQAEIVRHRFLADRGAAPAICPPRSLLPFAGTHV